MSSLAASIEGIGFWLDGLPSWPDACAFAGNGALPSEAQKRPSPQVLAPNERRRAPESVAVALDVAHAACQAAGRAPDSLASVFASMHGDLGITDYMCATLATEPLSVSPTKFHNSVHNAAAGYWTIGTGCMCATTAISAFDSTFAQGLLEALTQLANGEEAVLLVGYDTPSPGPLRAVSRSEGVLGGALVLAREGHGTRLRVTLVDGEPSASAGPLQQLASENAMAQMLPLFDALATGREDVVMLKAGDNRLLRVELAHA